MMIKRIANLLEVTSLLAVAAVLVGACGKWHFATDLASHFRLQSMLVLLVCAPILFGLKRRRWAIGCGVAGGVLLLTLLPLLLPAGTRESGSHRLLTVNVLTHNRQPRLVIDYIRQTDADFVLLQEVDARWIEKLDAGLAKSWPYRKCAPRPDNFGIALYSKTPWVSCEVVNFTNRYSTPSIDARFQLPDDRELRLIGIHPIPPLSQARWSARNTLFASVANDVQQYGGQRTVVAGDLNCSPWSYWFQRLLRESGLRDSAIGHGLRSTWMPYLPVTVCGLPIDHVLVGTDIAVTRRTVGPGIGSDHRGVAIDFE